MIHPRKTGEASKNKTSGFTLLEVVISLTIFTLLVGVIVPVVDTYIRPKRNNQTRDEMKDLSAAIVRFYKDVDAIPEALADLETKPDWASGWAGPYLATNFEEFGSVQNDFGSDEWLQPYTYETTADSFSLTSPGENRIAEGGNGDDIVLSGYLGVVNRDVTRKEMREIAIAIENFNRISLPGSPLSNSHPVLLGQLQDAGFLPSDTATTTRLSKDQWGNSYFTAVVPTMEVFSLGRQ